MKRNLKVKKNKNLSKKRNTKNKTRIKQRGGSAFNKNVGQLKEYQEKKKKLLEELNDLNNLYDDKNLKKRSKKLDKLKINFKLEVLSKNIDCNSRNETTCIMNWNNSTDRIDGCIWSENKCIRVLSE